MKKLILLFSLALNMMACNCDDNELALGLPDLFLAEASLAGDSLLIQFSHPIDPDSLIPGATLLIEGDSIDYSGAWAMLNDSIVYIPVCEIQCAQSQCTARLSLISQEGKPSVTSETGQRLDGDKDGYDGGNYFHDFLVPGCDTVPPPPPPPIVLSPADGQMSSLEYSITADKRFSFSVTFSAPMDTGTIAYGTTFLLFQPEFNQPLLGTISWASAVAFSFTSEPLPDYCSVPNDYHVQLTILGSTGMPVQSAAGVALDGDKDGMPGGDFMTQFLVSPPTASLPTVINFSLGMFGPPNIIDFSEPMDTSSFQPGVSISVQSSCSPDNNPVLDNFITLSWSNNNQTLTISHDYICPVPPDGPDKITLIGGCDGIKSACGVPLDGDGDGQPGGTQLIEGPSNCFDLLQPVSLDGYYNADCSAGYPLLERNTANNGFNFRIEFGTDGVDPFTAFLGPGGIEFFLVQDMNTVAVSGQLNWINPFVLEFQSDVIENFCMGMGDCCVMVKLSENILGMNCQLPLDGNFDFVPGGDFEGSFLMPPP